ncbi:Nuclear inhibitor of protein phosphatase 1 [Eumeta japonica]|uniref:Nuclear inhibitor of protein phosphatase 1 n=1 Tax=Eumeta variegata TaxID=151549 RepID=A0A4C1SLY8_EUMVA|nr:Nuclear inhibitor of protein phosphatase 1 [Eumeta japonica]
MEDIPMTESSDGALLGLPETQTELDKPSRKRRSVTFNDEEIIINPEDVDPNVGRFRNLVQTTVVPAKRARYEGSNIGISASVTTTAMSSSHNNTNLPNSHQLFQQNYQEHMKSFGNNAHANSTPSSPSSLYQGLPAATTHDMHATRSSEFDVTGPLAIGAKLGLLLPNPAPDVTPIAEAANPVSTNSAVAHKLALANANGLKRAGQLNPGRLVAAKINIGFVASPPMPSISANN